MTAVPNKTPHPIPLVAAAQALVAAQRRLQALHLIQTRLARSSETELSDAERHEIVQNVVDDESRGWANRAEVAGAEATEYSERSDSAGWVSGRFVIGAVVLGFVALGLFAGGIGLGAAIAGGLALASGAAATVAAVADRRRARLAERARDEVTDAALTKRAVGSEVGQEIAREVEGANHENIDRRVDEVSEEFYDATVAFRLLLQGALDPGEPGSLERAVHDYVNQHRDIAPVPLAERLNDMTYRNGPLDPARQVSSDNLSLVDTGGL